MEKHEITLWVEQEFPQFGGKFFVCAEWNAPDTQLMENEVNVTTDMDPGDIEKEINRTGDSPTHTGYFETCESAQAAIKKFAARIK
jgi:hypothetical protein